jgi:hypothetical protein
LVDNQNFSYNSINFETVDGNLEDAAEENKYQIDDEFAGDKTLQKILEKDGGAGKKAGLFAGMVFFLSTEVPRAAFEFMINSFGGRTLSDLDNFESDVYADNSITHVVTDRPAQSLNLDSRR